jgi:hypothetical protein
LEFGRGFNTQISHKKKRLALAILMDRIIAIVFFHFLEVSHSDPVYSSYQQECTNAYPPINGHMWKVGGWSNFTTGQHDQ